MHGRGRGAPVHERVPRPAGHRTDAPAKTGSRPRCGLPRPGRSDDRASPCQGAEADRALQRTGPMGRCVGRPLPGHIRPYVRPPAAGEIHRTIVFTMVTASAALEAVTTGPGGVLTSVFTRDKSPTLVNLDFAPTFTMPLAAQGLRPGALRGPRAGGPDAARHHRSAHRGCHRRGASRRGLRLLDPRTGQELRHHEESPEHGSGRRSVTADLICRPTPPGDLPALTDGCSTVFSSVDFGHALWRRWRRRPLRSPPYMDRALAPGTRAPAANTTRTASASWHAVCSKIPRCLGGRRPVISAGDGGGSGTRAAAWWQCPR